MLLEVIACSVNDALEAERGGAGRLEVVRELGKGGLTPALQLVEEITKVVSIPVRVMIREREGYFAGGAEAVEQLARLAGGCAALGVDDRVTVHRGDALRFVSRLTPGAFDIALADPPFSAGLAAPLVAAFREVPFAAVLAVEHFSKDAVEGDETRRYGDIALTFCYPP